MRFLVFVKISLAVCGLLLPVVNHADTPPANFTPSIPKTWDEAALAKLELPLAMPEYSPKEVPAAYYYTLPERPIYKQYTVYAPGREPADYWANLQTKEPEVIWGKDEAGVMHRPALKTREDWIQAGEIVFYAPKNIQNSDFIRTQTYFDRVHTPFQSDGVVPFVGYVIRKKGTVELGHFSCGMCHTRVLPNGIAVPGAQGNYPFTRTLSFQLSSLKDAPPDARKGTETFLHSFFGSFFSVPWLKPDPAQFTMGATWEQLVAVLAAIPPGVMDREGSSDLFPPQIPDLIGVEKRFYLDHTGLLRQQNPGDMMRYGSLNQDLNIYGSYKGWIPAADKHGELPPASTILRYSDEQLYALTLYLYSLKPPYNPNPFDELARQGQTIFQAQGCGGCHTPPLYTNNKLTLAPGFAKPADTYGDAVMPISVGTDPRLALQTRRGTGFYKVPSLLGVWYRGPFEHNGSVATLEDWFDAARLKDDYVPTGFVGYNVEHRVVPGHVFGTNLSPQNKRALIAFLKTL